MIRNPHYNWFEEEYGFFGDFYYISDNSNEGPYKSQSITREQRTIKEVEMVIRLLKMEAGNSVFDCPCGWGRHAIRLAKLGMNVTAIDLNRQYLSILQNSLNEENESVRDKIQIIPQKEDMRNISDKKSSFDFGINMFSSFGFFNDEENLKTAKNFYNMLKPQGKMLIYLDFNAQRLIEGKNEDYSSSRNIEHEGKSYTLEVVKNYCTDDKRLHGQWTLSEKDGKPIKKTYSFRIYDEQEMTASLQKAGFKNVSYYSSDESILLINSVDTVIVAEK